MRYAAHGKALVDIDVYVEADSLEEAQEMIDNADWGEVVVDEDSVANLESEPGCCELDGSLEEVVSESPSMSLASESEGCKFVGSGGHLE